MAWAAGVEFFLDTDKDMTLHGQVALVTGASRGLGRAIAKRLAAEGASVCVNYAAQSGHAESLVGEIFASGGRAIAIGADVGDAAKAEAMVRQVNEDLGPLTILVNNAGVAWRATLETFDVAGMERMRRTNVDGLVHMTRFAAQGMRERGYGRIVNISSIAGHGTAMPGNAFYAATKAAVSVLTKRFAMELGPFGITVNAVAPGFILTDMVKVGRSPEEYDRIVGKMSELSMVGRTGKPDDIAHAVAFLAAPESGFITAQVVTVDGGRMDYIGHS
ncbi:MAG: 3-oxoacyl-ACP reductase family protein [Acidobacteriota bacterium]